MPSIKKTYCDLIGWAGTFGVLGNYLALALGAQPNALYFDINVAAGIALVIHGVERRAWPVVGVNGTCALIGLVGLARLLW